MKKIIYAILICIIIAGIVVIATMGLKVDITYSKNVELDVYLGVVYEDADIEQIVNEVFPNERHIIQGIEVFGDMCAITLKDNRSEEELNSKIEELVTKINEKYELELEAEDVGIVHNPKARLLDTILPYGLPLGLGFLAVLIFAGVRYKKLGIVKTVATYIIAVVGVELLLLSIIAITRIPVNRFIIPIGLILFVIVITILGFINERKLLQGKETKKSK